MRAAQLSRHAATSWNRVQRPNVTALGGGGAEIEAVLEERQTLYEAVADHVFDVAHVTADEAVGHLVRMYL